MSVRRVQFSQKTASEVYKNGDWNTSFTDSVPMQSEGGQVIASVDNGNISGRTIYFPQETEIGIKFMYQELNTSFDGKETVNTVASADGLPYIAYIRDVSGNRAPLIGNITATVSGRYEPGGLADELTKQLGQTQPLEQSGRLETGNALLIGSDKIAGGGAVSSMNNIDYGTKPYPYASIAELDGDENAWGPTGPNGDPYYLGDGTGGYGNSGLGGSWVAMADGLADREPIAGLSDEDFHIESTETDGAGSGLVIRVKPFGSQPTGWFGPNVETDLGNIVHYDIVSGGSGYNRGDKVYFSSDQFGWISQDGTYYANRCESGARLVLTVDSIGDGSSYIEFIRYGEDPNNPTNSYKYGNGTPHWFGASEFQIQYNEEKNIFELIWCHTPFYVAVPDQPLQPAVQVNYNGSTWTTYDYSSSILPVHYYPDSIWNGVMNFNTELLTVYDVDGKPISSGAGAKQLGAIAGKFTTSYLNLNAFLDTTGSDPEGSTPIPTLTFTNTNALTNAISASEYVPQDGYGHLLVSITGLDRSMMVDRKLVECVGVVNIYESVNGIATSIIPITYPVDCNFSDVRVRFLDPATLEVPDGLGSRSIVYFEIP